MDKARLPETSFRDQPLQPLGRIDSDFIPKCDEEDAGRQLAAAKRLDEIGGRFRIWALWPIPLLILAIVLFPRLPITAFLVLFLARDFYLCWICIRQMGRYKRFLLETIYTANGRQRVDKTLRLRDEVAAWNEEARELDAWLADGISDSAPFSRRAKIGRMTALGQHKRSLLAEIEALSRVDRS